MVDTAKLFQALKASLGDLELDKTRWRITRSLDLATAGTLARRVGHQRVSLRHVPKRTGSMCPRRTRRKRQLTLFFDPPTCTFTSMSLFPHPLRLRLRRIHPLP
ncbi:hypothetical protein PsYK624_067870 [Phanerochaete sordida]|uniref:Uncharacterized protein n=1 Tax=Phanerochaete sordida TaxID=48140 RepID=A0A9P3LDR6_9APHY|nr:hypothetical protein PsYK624_067870 [Phanerochaete sordida]